METTSLEAELQSPLKATLNRISEARFESKCWWWPFSDVFASANDLDTENKNPDAEKMCGRVECGRIDGERDEVAKCLRLLR